MIHIHPINCGLGFAFLIEKPNGLFLIDSGSPGQHGQVLKKMQKLGRTDLKLIWITHAHYDHYGSAAALRKLTGAQIGVHPGDSQSLAGGVSPLGTSHHHGFLFHLAQPIANQIWRLPATPPDFMLEDGETLENFGLEASIMHTPGHTPGHTCLLLPDNTAFAGDLIGSYPSPRLQELAATDWNQLPTSFARFQAAQPQQIYTGHSPQPISGKVLQNLNK